MMAKEILHLMHAHFRNNLNGVNTAVAIANDFNQ